jgi:hypothetical protein
VVDGGVRAPASFFATDELDDGTRVATGAIEPRGLVGGRPIRLSSRLFLLPTERAAEDETLGVDSEALCRPLLARVIEEPFVEIEAGGDVRASLDASLRLDWTDGGLEVTAGAVKIIESLFVLAGLLVAGVTAAAEVRECLRLYCGIHDETSAKDGPDEVVRTISSSCCLESRAILRPSLSSFSCAICLVN